MPSWATVETPTRAEYEPVTVRSEIPRPHYTVSYAGEAIWAESSMQAALDRVVPGDPFWEIECQLYQDCSNGVTRKVGPRRVVYPPS